MVGAGDVASMVALQAQVWHSKLPPKGCMVLHDCEGGHPSGEACTFCRSLDGKAESISYLGNLHNTASTSVLLRVTHSHITSDILGPLHC